MASFTKLLLRTSTTSFQRVCATNVLRREMSTKLVPAVTCRMQSRTQLPSMSTSQPLFSIQSAPTATSATQLSVQARNCSTEAAQSVPDATLAVLKLYDKVDPEKVTLEARFVEDLGLDSLDVVELVMALEDEFDIEISDEEAEKILTVQQAVDLVVEKKK